MALALATTFVSGFVILNSFYTWPKLLPVAFLFILPAYLFTDRFSSVRADWRVGAAVGAAAGFAHALPRWKRLRPLRHSSDTLDPSSSA